MRTQVHAHMQCSGEPTDPALLHDAPLGPTATVWAQDQVAARLEQNTGWILLTQGAEFKTARTSCGSETQ